MAKSWQEMIEEKKKKILEHKNTAVRNVTYDLYDRIVTKTPVDTGETRISWEVVPISEMTITHDGGTSNRSVKNIGFSILTYAPQVPVLEYGLYPTPPKKPETAKITNKGFSKQAPEGFIRISLKEVANEWKK